MTTTTQTTSSVPSFHVRGRSSAHGVALIALCLALGGAFVSQVWSGPSAEGTRARPAAAERA
jgi:hypothetical protein